jgi:hypothetical protein
MAKTIMVMPRIVGIINSNRLIMYDVIYIVAFPLAHTIRTGQCRACELLRSQIVYQ